MSSRYVPKATRMALDAQAACQACGGPGPFEADHSTPHALGGGNGADNLQNLCIPCHRAKTRHDVKAIAKVKRIVRKQAGTWRPNRKRIRSRGFDKRLRRRMDGSVVRR